MMRNDILELLEPKMPPINLWCLTPASWFYYNKESKPTPVYHISIKEDKTLQLQTILRDR